MGPMTPFFGTPGFLLALSTSGFGPWRRTEHRRLTQVLWADPSLTTDIPFASLSRNRTQWLQRQVMSYIYPFHTGHFHRTDGIWGYVSTGWSSAHVVSQLYSLLLNASSPNLPLHTQVWDSELCHTISLSEWQKCFTLTQKLSIVTKNQEKGFKLVTRWYRCPSTIHHSNTSIPDSCWRCHASKGSILHIWWGCPHKEILETNLQAIL